MTPAKKPSPLARPAAPSSRFPRWPLAVGALVLVPGVILGVLLARRWPDAPGKAAASASAAPAPRGPAPVAIAARPRAGISGHVRDPEGHALPGATVCAFAPRALGITTAQTQVPRCVMGDAAGAYALMDLFPQVALTVSASAPSFPPQAYRGGDGDGTLRLAEGEQRASVDFVMAGGGVKIAGRVGDATGGVVAGAIVVSEGNETARATATTDEKGEFSLWVAPGPVNLGATAMGYAPGHTRGPAPGHFFSLYLVPGATLVGRAVVAGTDTPVAGAQIEAIQVEGGNARAADRSDPDGRFRIEGLTPGRFRIEATAEGREGYSHSSITLGMGETSPETLVELDPAYVVKGKVVEKGSGEPCPKGSVTITDDKQNEFSQGSIEPDGSVRMASVIPGTYKVEVSCEGRVSRDDYPPITIRDADAPLQTWEIERGGSVRVAVVDPSGKTIPAATVSAYAIKNDDSFGGSTEHPEADGTFVVNGLKPGTYHLSVRTPEGARGDQDEVIVDGRREERVKIELPLAGAIEGVVEDLDHHPIANVTVVASGPRRQGVRSLDDGTFVLSGLPSGEYTLTPQDPSARGRGGDDDDARKTAPKPVTVTVTAPGRARARLTLEKRVGTISGRVVDQDDQPITDAFIEYARSQGNGVPRFGGGGGNAPVVTDTEGRFTIEGLLEGEYGLRAYRKGGGEGTADHVKVGARGVSLRIGLGASIAGVLTSPKGNVERFSLLVRDRKTAFHREEMFFHAQGAFAVRDLPPGTYELVAETPQGTATGEVTVAEGEQKKGLTLTMAMRGTVDGRVVSAEGGAPVAGVRVMVTGDGSATVMSGNEGRGNITGPDGRFHLEGVLSGKWSLMVSAIDGAAGIEDAILPVEIGASGETDLGNVQVKKRAAPDVHGELGVDGEGEAG